MQFVQVCVTYRYGIDYRSNSVWLTFWYCVLFGVHVTCKHHIEHQRKTSVSLLEVLLRLKFFPQLHIHIRSHLQSPGGEKHRQRKRSKIFFGRTREQGHRWSDEHWNCFKGNVRGNFSETGRSAYVFFFSRAYTYQFAMIRRLLTFWGMYNGKAITGAAVCAQLKLEVFQWPSQAAVFQTHWRRSRKLYEASEHSWVNLKYSENYLRPKLASHLSKRFEVTARAASKCHW